MEQTEKIPANNKWLVYGVISCVTALVLGFLLAQLIAQNTINDYKEKLSVSEQKIIEYQNKIAFLQEEITILQNKNNLSDQEKNRLKTLLEEQKIAVMELLNEITKINTMPTTTYTHSGGGGSGGVS